MRAISRPNSTVLEWIGKPVIVLLNQTGPPRTHEDEAADEARWREALGARLRARGAGARRLRALLGAGDRAVRGDRAAAAGDEAPGLPPARAGLAGAAPGAVRAVDGDPAPIGAAAAVRRASAVPTQARHARIGKSMGIARDAGAAEQRRAPQALLETARDAASHGDGPADRHPRTHRRAAARTCRAPAQQVCARDPSAEGKAAMMGGVVSGALSGLAADLAAGGFTFGAGMLAGAVLGALGGAGSRAASTRPRASRARRCAGTMRSSRGWSGARCCAISRSRTTAAGAATTAKANVRRSGVRWSSRGSGAARAAGGDLRRARAALRRQARGPGAAAAAGAGGAGGAGGALSGGIRGRCRGGAGDDRARGRCGTCPTAAAKPARRVRSRGP